MTVEKIPGKSKSELSGIATMSIWTNKANSSWVTISEFFAIYVISLLCAPANTAAFCDFHYSLTIYVTFLSILQPSDMDIWSCGVHVACIRTSSIFLYDKRLVPESQWMKWCWHVQHILRKRCMSMAMLHNSEYIQHQHIEKFCLVAHAHVMYLCQTAEHHSIQITNYFIMRCCC